MTNELVLFQSHNHSNIFERNQLLNKNGNENLQSTKTDLSEILFLTTFPPCECGIATYSQDLAKALNTQFHNSFKTVICALESDKNEYYYKTSPKYILNTDDPNAFENILFNINNDNNIKLVVIQHEFGLFAKNEEEFFYLLKQIYKPIIIAFHTVLPQPNETLKLKVQKMAEIAKMIIVMTKSASKILNLDYQINEAKITIIPHGSHLSPAIDRTKLKKQHHLSKRKVLTTFGFLGSSKNIETSLMALPEVIKLYPEVLFLILGKTHPSTIKHEGETYRQKLEELVKSLKIDKNVRFVNEYLPLNTLLEYLQLTDIYLFTSNDKHQAVSGTFAYAISSGCSVISTPIPHALEVLNKKNGIIFDFENVHQLAKAIINLLNNEKLRLEISSNSYHQMAASAWQNSAIAHAQLFNKIINPEAKLKYNLPPINFNHIKRLTTDFAMIQFSKIAHPDIRSGYTLDDNARALVAFGMHYELFKKEQDLIYIDLYLKFIKFCFQTNGRFLNYVNVDKEFTQQNFKENLEDSNGRAIWALGYICSLQHILPIYIFNEANILLEKAIVHLDKIHSTRAMAFIIKGLYYQNNNENLHLITIFANRLKAMYLHEKTKEWHWFESYLTYANSLLCEAMLCAYKITHENDYKLIAKESFDFLLSKIIVNQKIKVISNNGWQLKDKKPTNQIGGEQPIDVAYTIMALEEFHKVFKNEKYDAIAKNVINWFLGDNHLNQIVYNPITGGCYDGVEENNVNLNQGAESTISFCLSRLTIERLTAEKQTYERLKFDYSIKKNSKKFFLKRQELV